MPPTSAVSPALLLAAVLLLRRGHVAAVEDTHVVYHMGPVMSSPMRVWIIWYGSWSPAHVSAVRDFLLSVSDGGAATPSVKEWWSTATLYVDQTGANVTRSLSIAGETSDPRCSHGVSLTRFAIQRVIAGVNVTAPTVNVYLLLTGAEVAVEGVAKGGHFFTFRSIAGDTVPYAWASHGDAGEVVGRVGRELADLATNPLANAWYAGPDQAAPTEIADLCRGSYRANGRAGRTFPVPRLWRVDLNRCAGPTSVD